MNSPRHSFGMLTPSLVRKSWFIAIGILVVSTVISGVIIALPRPNAAQAAPTVAPSLTVNPPAQSYFAQNKLRVQGSNYPMTAEIVKIYWDYQNANNPGTLEASTTSGNGTFSVAFTIPLAPAGNHTIAGVGQTSNTVATTTFQMYPNLSAVPRATGAGSPFTISGFAFGANETVDIYWNCASNCSGTPLLKTPTDSNGTFQVTAKIPTNASFGKTPILAIGENSGQSDTANLIVYTPTLALAPLSGSAGTMLTLTAYGFQSNENVKVYWNNGTKPIFPSVPTTLNGYVQVPVFTVPTGTASGSYPVKIVGITSHVTASNTFTVVAPSVSLSATSGPIGTRVRVSGQGYVPQESVNIYWDYKPGAAAMATMQASPSGTFHVSFIVPTSTNASDTVTAIGAKGNITKSNTFTVTAGLTASPTSFSPGRSTTITGSGFQSGENVKLSWDSPSGTQLSAPVAADVNGNMNKAVTIPTATSCGSHTIYAVGKTSGKSFQVQVTVDTSWNDFGFSASHLRVNSFENSVNTGNVGNLQPQWQVSIGTPQPEGAPSPIYYNGMVYIATFDGYLNAYDATTGNLKWQFPTGTHFANLTSPVIDPATNTLFFGTLGYLEEQDHGVPSPSFALDAQTGALKWSEILNGDDYGFPTMAFNTIYVGLGNEGNGGLLALDEDTGYVNGYYNAHTGVWGAVGVDTKTNMLFTGIADPYDEVLAFDATTFTGTNMQPKWKFQAFHPGSDDDIGSAIAVANGTVYVDTKGGFIYAVNESDGSQVWESRIGGNSEGNVSSPAVDTVNGILYVGSLDYRLYALKTSDGTPVWKVKTGDQVYSSPALANGVIYVASNDGNIYAYNAAAGGQPLWKYNTNATTFSSPILVNGWLYCASVSGKLYAFSL